MLTLQKKLNILQTQDIRKTGFYVYVIRQYVREMKYAFFVMTNRGAGWVLDLCAPCRISLRRPCVFGFYAHQVTLLTLSLSHKCNYKYKHSLYFLYKLIYIIKELPWSCLQRWSCEVLHRALVVSEHSMETEWADRRNEDLALHPTYFYI